MAWRDGLRKGSFRGAEFEFEDAGGEHGRRVPKHVFPLRDGAEGEDLGEKAGDFTLSALIIDQDFAAYTKKKLALINAIRAPGTGKLVHPTLGEMTVWLTAKWDETVEEMGVCRFQLTFWEETPSDGSKALDTGAVVDGKAGAAVSASTDSFASRFSISGLESSVGKFFTDNFRGVISVIKQASGYIHMASSLAGQVVGFIDGQALNALGFIGSITSLGGSGGISALINLPATLGLRFSSLISSMSFIGGSNSPVTLSSWSMSRQIGPQSVSVRGQVPQGYDQAALDALRKAQLAIADKFATTDVAILLSRGALPASGAGAPLPLFPRVGGITDAAARAAASATTPAINSVVGNTGSSIGISLPFAGSSTAAGKAQIRNSYATTLGVTPGQLQQAINQVELLDLGRRIAIIEAAQAAVASRFASSQDAIKVRDNLADRLDVECLVATDDAVRATLFELRLAMFQAITDQAADLPRLVTITLQQSLPAVVLAHRLYDDPSFADDICARNGVDNSLFLPAGVPLEVLSG
jgi:prophage DNA circulation protein